MCQIIDHTFRSYRILKNGRLFTQIVVKKRILTPGIPLPRKIIMMTAVWS